MRMPRFTTRRLMVLVAVAALLSGAWTTAIRLLDLRTQYRLRAELHGANEAAYQVDLLLALSLSPSVGRRRPHVGSIDRRLMNELILASGSKDLLVDWEPPQVEPDSRIELRSAASDDPQSNARAASWERLERKISHERTMRNKYDRLSHYPWLSVPPDPPAPD